MPYRRSEVGAVDCGIVFDRMPICAALFFRVGYPRTRPRPNRPRLQLRVGCKREGLPRRKVRRASPPKSRRAVKGFSYLSGSGSPITSVKRPGGNAQEFSGEPSRFASDYRDRRRRSTTSTRRDDSRTTWELRRPSELQSWFSTSFVKLHFGPNPFNLN